MIWAIPLASGLLASYLLETLAHDLPYLLLPATSISMFFYSVGIDLFGRFYFYPTLDMTRIMTRIIGSNHFEYDNFNYSLELCQYSIV